MAWRLDADDGEQGSSLKANYNFVCAVSPGRIAAVPEPESVAMLLLGLGVVAGVVRRRCG
ncbi:PEP-CTERM sorting domain-containing protein [Methylophilus sp. YYY-1]|nr:PEP-CTERM sorting domain-containing protein [Methylophilus sp. YYY-1]